MTQQDDNPGPRRTLHRAAALVDAAGTIAAPGVILTEGSQVIAAGTPEDVGQVAGARVEQHSGVLIPALVNAHAHLDLTGLGPRPMEGAFTDWGRLITAHRKSADDASIASATRQGIELARRGGTALLGDISGAFSLIPTVVQRECGLPGVSYCEVFGAGTRQAGAIDRMQQRVDGTPACDRGVVLGVSPHAPYSCGPRVYSAAARLGLPFVTHLAETCEEIEFTTTGGGPFRDFLVELGVWDDSVDVAGVHPVDAVLAAVDNLSVAPMLAVHLNYVTADHIEMLAGRGVHVAYCPRASAYFGHADHRYRDMLAGGVNVALGTDSIICLDTPGRLSVLDEMRVLHERDGLNVLTLLGMATTNGARALGFDESLVTLKPGVTAGVLALEWSGDPPRGATAEALLAMALAEPQDPQWIAGPAPCEAFTPA